MDRRAFLLSSSGAAAGSFLVAGLPETAAAAPAGLSESALVTGVPKALKHTEIPGFLSAAQIAPHHTAHYGGALTAFKGVEAQFVARLMDGLTVQGSATYNDNTQNNSPCLTANEPNSPTLGKCITEINGKPFVNPFGVQGGV